MQTHLTVTVYSHHFVVSRMTPRGREACMGFSRPLVSWKMQVHHGHASRVPDRVYAAADVTKNYFRFHIHMLDQWKAWLHDLHLTDSLVEWIYAPVPKATPVELIVKPKWQDKEDQVDHIKYLATSPHPARLLTRQTGSGKAQPLTAKIKVPGGWKTMGEMAIGQEVITQDGSITFVTGVFPQGVKDIYKVTFQDGRSTECCGEHLWQVHQPSRNYGAYWKVVNTQEMIRILRLSNDRLYVDVIEPEQGEDVELPMNPYLLGVLLGDGHIGENVLKLSSADEFIVDKVRGLLPEGMSLAYCSGVDYNLVRDSAKTKKNPLLQVFEDLKLKGSKSHTKFVPQQYLEASAAQRLELLQGLMDADGCAEKCGSNTYSTSSWQLATDVRYLVRSLGGKATISVKHTKYTHNGEELEGRVAFIVHISFKRPNQLYSLPRKQERAGDWNQYSEFFKLRVVKIEKIGQKEAQCISVYHPSRLYVTDDFIVTHNTYCALKAISMIGLLPCIVIKSMYIDKWIEDVMKTYEIKTKEIMVIKGSSHLKSLLNLAVAGELRNVKVIIVSITTIQNWITEYEEQGKLTLDTGYPVEPWAFFETIGAGVKLVDEVHQHFHQMFKLDLYTHVQHSISLSATLLSQDSHIERMYEIMFPSRTRTADLALRKYIDAYAVHYEFKVPEKIRTTEFGSKNYSHTAMEKSIMKHVPTMLAYMRLIDETLQISYFKHPRPNKRCAVFAASIEMCTKLTEYFKRKYPHLDIRRYCDDDPYENAIDADIRFTTVGSMGTAIDVPDLTTVILTVALSSIQGNIQVLGRLRDLKDHYTEFYFFTASNIDKHVQYCADKREMLEKRAKSYRDVFSGLQV